MVLFQGNQNMPQLSIIYYTGFFYLEMYPAPSKYFLWSLAL